MNSLSYSIAAILLLVSAQSNGANPSEQGSCGNASVVEGYSCADAKVQFSFNNCLLKSEPRLATTKSCKGDSLTAVYEKDGYRYEASFSKSQNNWGATTWTLNGAVKQEAAPAVKESEVAKSVEKKAPEKKIKKVVKTPKVTPAPKPVAKKQEEEKRAPASLPAVVAPPVVAPTPAPAAGNQSPTTPATTTTTAFDGSLKFSGFFDFRLTNFSRDSRAGASGMPESGFGLEDGALYLNYQKDSLSFLLDVPFRRLKNSDVGTTQNGNASPNGNMVWGNDKAQAYVKYAASDFEVAFGQFDTVYGVEVNDSKDRYFAKEGLVYTYILPVTHTGVLASYNFLNGGYVRLLSADPNNKGSLGSSSTGDNNYEYGTLLGYSNDVIRGQIGYLSRPINKASGIGGGKRSLVDVTAGATLGKWSIDLEYSDLADDSKGTLDPSNLNEKEADGIGALALVSYSFTDKWSLGARFEHIENDPGQVGIVREDSYGLSAHYRWLKTLETRVEFIQNRYQEVSLPSQNLTDNRFEISNIFSF